ncbi:MAG: YidB family protein [Xanthobacteraceae bacterium]
MGLLDILNGMQNGPRGPSDTADQSGSEGKSEGMSPMTMAILAILAYKAIKHFGGSSETSTAPAGGGTAAPAPRIPEPTEASAPGGGLGGALGGGLGDLLKGGLGGLLAGGAAGSILSGGLADLLKQMQQSGHGDAAESWVGKGDNKTIAPDDLANALGADQINALTSRTGLSRDQLLSELSQYLPEAVDQFTPDGHIPSERDLSRWL